MIKQLLAVTAVALIGLTGCTKYSEKKQGVTSTSGVTKIAVDASFENIMQQEIEVFEYIYPDASVLPYYLDEKSCVDSLLELKVPSVVLARDLTAQEKQFLTSKKRTPKVRQIAVDALALIVNKENTTSILSMKEIGEILRGEVTDWNQLEPSKLGKIEVVFDHEASSTVKYMRDSLMNGADFGSNVYAQGSNKGVFEAVQNHKNAIGVIGVSWLSSDLKTGTMSTADIAESLERSDTTALDFSPAVKVLKVRRDDSLEAYKPYQQYIYDGKYPLYRSIYMATTGVGGTTSHGFYSFVTSFRGQKIILLTGVLPALVQPRQVNVE